MIAWSLPRMKLNERPIARLKQINHILNPQRGFSSVKQGSKYSPNFKQYLKLPNGETGSFFHDVPMDLNLKDRTAQMIVEVPRWSNGKFEISKDLEYNPIVQDMKKGKVRFVHNIFPYCGYIHNYGAIPQTWEDPTENSRNGGLESLAGDNDPLDCCEIGSSILQTGDIKTVRILGSLALIDDGELDWKIIAINVEDPISSQLQNLNDVNKYLPGILEATREWFRDYKIPDGKPSNSFAFNGQYKDVADTIEIIQDCHDSWKKLVSGSKENEDFKGLPQIKRAGADFAVKADEQPAQPIPKDIHKWWYI
ncbi:hypothetical protein HG535_0F00470 [Zygotorulaspora mrakii]|uniref:inorganic diphosphatase n=1 Tax=Zygotorulaspora mrakii TaxID=42260 RepID=A0A7H9B4S1_ZYGMR|nr:uncharacterized protein HG535_0F00470 [Zygotorulaspora mrakii]QLG73537.1 hypothetical protein HG535_0F00470 [Zygotorulaspora mrakii]